MFDIGWTELLTVAVVAIVVIGPKDLPRAMRTVGQWSGKMRRMAREFQGQFNEALREAELDSVRKDVEEIAKIDPLADMKKEMAKVGSDLKKTGSEIKQGLDVPATPASGTPSPDMAAPAAEAKAEAPAPADDAARTIAAPKPADTAPAVDMPAKPAAETAPVEAKP
jgi:sec-independent protein translocase protein TatB